MNQKQKRQSALYSLRFASNAIAVCSIVALSVATGLLFISPQMSLVIYALTGMALFFGNSLEDRKDWEDKAQRSFHTLQNRYDNLVLQVEKNKRAISSLSREVERVSETLEKHEQQRKSEPVYAPSFSDMMDKVKEPKPKPKSKISPLAYKKPVNVVANDTKRADSYNDTLSDIVVHELMSHAVKNKDIELFVQPIVRLPAGDTRFYEVFGRVKAREGAYISASRYMKFARDDKVIGKIDQQVLLHALQTLREKASMDDMPSFFLNIEASSLRDMEFMNLLLAFLAKNRTLSSKLVLEIPQKIFEGRDHKTGKILTGLRTLGCAFSIDHIEKLDLSISDLVSMRVRFVKLPSSMMMEAQQDQRQMVMLQQLKRQLENNGIGVIAERVETIKTLDKLSEFHLNYAQGYLFGRPDTQLHYSLRKAA